MARTRQYVAAGMVNLKRDPFETSMGIWKKSKCQSRPRSPVSRRTAPLSITFNFRQSPLALDRSFAFSVALLRCEKNHLSGVDLNHFAVRPTPPDQNVSPLEPSGAKPSLLVWQSSQKSAECDDTMSRLSK
jgi:hypothetical protein